MNDQTTATGQSEHTGQVASVSPLLSGETTRPVTKSSVAVAAAGAGLSIEEVASLFEVAGSEDEAMRQLDDSVALLHEVQQAKAELRQVSPTKLRAALKLRAAALRGATA